MFIFNRGFALIALAALLWGTVGICTKSLYGLAETNSLSIGFFRLGIAALVLLGMGWWQYRGRLFQFSLRGFLGMALIGAMLALYQVCFFAAIPLAGITVSTLITLCVAPVFVVAMELLRGKEKPSSSILWALVLAVVGTLLLVGVGGQAQVMVRGVLFALTSAFGYATMAVTGRRIANDFPSLQINAVAFSIGAILLLLVALPQHLVLSYPPRGVLLLLYLGLVPTALGYLLFLNGMRQTPASVASILTLVEPLTATLLAHFFFHEQLSPTSGLGGIALLSALVVLSRKQ